LTILHAIRKQIQKILRLHTHNNLSELEHEYCIDTSRYLICIDFLQDMVEHDIVGLNGIFGDISAATHPCFAPDRIGQGGGRLSLSFLRSACHLSQKI
jgi:hypothetical protein